MKKFLVILMVVAMASFLFVGCLPGVTPPDVDDEDEDEEEVVPTSAIPALAGLYNAVTKVAIIDLTAAATQYVNTAEAGTLILVQGTAPAESLVSIYLDDVAITAAVGEASTSTLWSIYIAKSALGDDGVKVITAKCTEVGLAESVASNPATFTLDTVKPSATTLTASAFAADDHDVTSAFTGGATVDSAVVSTAADLVAGTYTVTIMSDSATAENIEVAAGTGTMITRRFTVLAAGFVGDGVIPGVRFNIRAAEVDAVVGSVTTLTVTDDDAILDRATVVLSEKITSASAIAVANYTWANSTSGVAPVDTPVAYKSSTLTTYFTLDNTLDRFDAITCLVNGLEDLAGNIQTTVSNIGCVVGVAHATTLAP